MLCRRRSDRRWRPCRSARAGCRCNRVPGGKGSPVFAFTAEIDAWLQSAPQEIPPETPQGGQGAADAIYNFTPDLALLRATFSERYGEIHDQLQDEKKLDHGRAECPDKDGPRQVHVWSPGTGWTVVSPGKPRA